jgi:alpha-L-arabinofuranosidase
MNRRIAFIFLISISILSGYAQPHRLQVDTEKTGAPIQPTMWGVFFEDINFGADGGLYAELVKNRSFEFLQPLMGWKEQQSDKFKLESNAGKAMILNRGDNAPNSRFARVAVLADKGYGLSNEGFRGMGIKQGESYTFSIWARQQDGNPSIRVELVDSKGNAIGKATLSISGKEWKRYEVKVMASGSDAKATLNVWFDGKGVVDVDLISLFPDKTWKNRPAGLRHDLVQLLADLKPGFLRFPGGCIVEGRDLSQRYQWKKTIGKPEERELLINRWNTEFNHRPAPDYFQSFGLGFFEYFQMAEDIGAEPLPILSCGLACQFNTAEVVPMDQLDPYIQDALDLIEFANGAATTKWGKLRSEMGHPAPFNLKFIGVGNEQWGPQYIERYEVFVKAIKAKYPDVKIISGTGPFPEGELFDYAAKKLKELKAEIVDEHYYAKPEWFFSNVTRYDKYDRNGPKVFAGEYAAQSVAIASPENKNNWQCALSEAAFMTGLERNADVVHMCSYAPLFAHAEGWQWTPDLIWFDNLNAYATPNYHVQRLFSNNRGTHALPVKAGTENVIGQKDIFASAVLDKNANEIIVKVVSNSSSEQAVTIDFKGKRVGPNAKITTLSGVGSDVNTFDQPDKIKPVDSTLKVNGKSLSMRMKPYSFVVIRVPAK